MTTEKEHIELMVEKANIANNDVVLLKGEWPTPMVEQMAGRLQELGIKTLLVVLPENELKFETMPIEDFYGLLKACEKQLGFTSEGESENSYTDGVSGD